MIMQNALKQLLKNQYNLTLGLNVIYNLLLLLNSKLKKMVVITVQLINNENTLISYTPTSG